MLLPYDGHWRRLMTPLSTPTATLDTTSDVSGVQAEQEAEYTQPRSKREVGGARPMVALFPPTIGGWIYGEPFG